MIRNPLIFKTALSFAMLSGLTAGHAGDIEMNLESPTTGQIAFGVQTLRGWAVSTAGIDRVELYINGTYRTDIPMGGMRADVADDYPEQTYPGSSDSGFSMAYAYGLLADGPNTITVQVIDNDGAMESRSADFTTIGRDVGYVFSLDDFDLSQASVSGIGNTITIGNALINGVGYNLEMQWNTQAQQFQVSNINPVNI
jgi:hypothetical protein